MNFWKFECYGNDHIAATLERGLPLPAEPATSPLESAGERLLSELRAGDVVILATLLANKGEISAVGKVRDASQESGALRIQWTATRKTVSLDALDLALWSTKTAFQIDSTRAIEHGLRDIADFYVPD